MHWRPNDESRIKQISERRKHHWQLHKVFQAAKTQMKYQNMTGSYIDGQSYVELLAVLSYMRTWLEKIICQVDSRWCRLMALIYTTVWSICCRKCWLAHCYNSVPNCNQYWMRMNNSKEYSKGGGQCTSYIICYIHAFGTDHDLD